MVTGRLPTIPEYWNEVMHKESDLMMQPMQPCPFHSEVEPSFSFSRELGIASCFGKCKALGMDVIEMHRRFMHITTRDEAEDSIRALYKCRIQKKIKAKPERMIIDSNKVEFQSLLIEANILANNVDKWIELDYVMSQYPVESDDISKLIDKWRGN